MTTTATPAASAAPLSPWRAAWRCAWPAVGVAAGAGAAAYLLRGRLDALVRFDETVIAAATALTRADPTLRTALLVWEHVFLERYVYGAATLLCLWVGRRHGMPRRAWWAFLTMMLAWNLHLDLKYVVRRLRPVVEPAVSHAPGFSFPSGHVANVAAAGTAVVLLLWPLLRRRGPAAVAGAVGVVAVLTLVTALDRVLLGVHFPSDTVAGAVIGPAIVLVSYAGYRSWVASSIPDAPSALRPQPRSPQPRSPQPHSPQPRFPHPPKDRT